MPIPKVSEPIAGQLPVSVSWRAYLEGLDRRIASLANAGTPDATIPDAGRLIPGEGITLYGSIDYGQVATVSLSLLPDSGLGAGLVKIARDTYGRVEGTEAATTTDLPEGANLYYTDERVRDAVGATLVAGTNVTIAPNDGADTITISATGGDFPAATTETRTVRIGNGRTGDGISELYLIGDTTYPTYGLRIRRAGGANASSSFTHRGTGSLYFNAVEGYITLATANVDRLSVNNAGTLTLLNGAGFANGTSITGAAGSARRWGVRTGTSPRWEWGADGTAESGSNAGSNYVLRAFDDAGASLGDSVTVSRATRAWNFVVSPTVPTVTAGDNSTKAASTAYADTAAAAKVQDSITDGVTEKAPSQNAVFDALALKSDDAALTVIAGLSANQTLANATATKVPLNTESVDTDGCFNTTTGVFTPTKSGLYLVIATGSFSVNPLPATSGERLLVMIYRNGALYTSVTGTTHASVTNTAQVFSLIRMNGTTDYLEMYMRRDTTATYDMNATGILFSAMRVSA